MKKYTVEWEGADNKPINTMVVEAENGNDAFDKAVEHCATFEWRKVYPKMNIISADGSVNSWPNPHFDSNYEETIKESHSLQPQSSGWATFHNVCGYVGIAIIFIGLYRIYGLYVRIRHNPDEKITVNEFELMWQNTFGLIELGTVVTIANFFMAFFINVITEIQNNTRLAVEYQKRTFDVLENWGK